MIAINLHLWGNCHCYVWLPEGITKLALAYFHQKGNNIQTKNKITTTSEIITSRWVLIPAQPWRISALSSYVKLICLEIWLFFFIIWIWFSHAWWFWNLIWWCWTNGQIILHTVISICLVYVSSWALFLSHILFKRVRLHVYIKI
jgi:hypothetical protein